MLSPRGAAGSAGRDSVFMCFVPLQHLRLRSCWWERREEHHDAVPRRVCAGHLQPGEGRHAVYPSWTTGGRRLPQRKCPEQGPLLHTHQDPGGPSEGITLDTLLLGAHVQSWQDSPLTLLTNTPPFPGPFGCMRKRVVWLLGFHIPTGTKVEAWISRVTLKTKDPP